MEKTLETQIEKIAEKFLQESKNKDIQIISHFDTDGITSAAILVQTLRKLDKKFSLQIVKNLEKEFIDKLPKNKLTIFLDLASNSMNHIQKAELQNVFIIDHHEITQEIPGEINILSTELLDSQKISASSITYLFCRKINPHSKELAKLAILGMIGDMLEKEIDKLNNGILEQGEIKRKRGLLIYPSTRPLNRALEFCSNPYIPGVTGDIKGVLELLREVGLNPQRGKYKSLIELNEEEMEKLVTAIMLRNPKSKNLLGDIFLIKFFSKLEDARELSAMVNACSRMGRTDVAVQLCMELPQAKKKAESIYAKYKQLIVAGLKFMSETEKLSGNGFVIINARNSVRETIVGTLASILSNSLLYEEGTAIITMAYYKNKIKISARNVGRCGRNVREVLASVTDKISGEVGGHEHAAGAIITQDKEEEFIENLKKQLEVEVVRV